jgi:8-oxo-dGTP diphosphatase
MKQSEQQVFSGFMNRSYKGPYTATDIIIRYNDGKKDGVILIERLNEPYGIAWPGGIGERMPNPRNAVKESREETGLVAILDEPLRPFLALSGIDDDPRDFISTNVYTAQGSGILMPDPKEDAKRAFLVDHDELYALTQSKNLWAMERHRRVGVLYLDHIGFEKAKGEAASIRRKITQEYRL